MTVPGTVRQDGFAIGRITSDVFTFTFTSGSTTPAEDFADFRIFAGGIVNTPTHHTGTIYFQESDNYGGLSAGRHGDETGANYSIAGAVGGRPYSMPAGIFPAWFIRPELGTAATGTRVYRMRGKG